MAVIVALVYVPVAVMSGGRWDPLAFLVVAGGTCSIILLGAAVQRMQLRGGGKAVAESLGGVWLNPVGASPAERRLLDVVEEMSIASGMPVPPVYQIDDESINAFAAGNTPNDAVLGFTRGAISSLARDELQGVVAHEFSHIAHGDMRLNIRLACAVAGVMVLMLIGRALLHGSRFSGKSKNQGGLLLCAACLMIIGAVGAFFGRILQAAISRQREFLADASAAQYTRHPESLARALRLIAGVHNNTLQSSDVSGLNHFFFTSAANTWLASHPPIHERIRRLEESSSTTQIPTTVAVDSSQSTTVGLLGLAGGHQVAPGLHVASTTPVAHADIPSMSHVLHQRISQPLLEACKQPFDAQAVLLLCTWAGDTAVQDRQLKLVEQHLGPALVSTVSRLRQPMELLPESMRIVVVDLCMPAIQQLTHDQYRPFSHALVDCIRADGKVSLFEWTLRTMLSRRVDARHVATPDRPGTASLATHHHDALLLLSALAWTGGSDRAQAALSRGLANLSFKPQPLSPASECSLDAVHQALGNLVQINEAARHQLVRAAVATMTEDGVVKPHEALLVRAIADGLNVIIPNSIELVQSDFAAATTES